MITDMASDFSGPFERERVNWRRRDRGRDTSWSCDKHTKPVRFYCEYHVIAICDMCVTENHTRCNLENIDDIIDEMKRKKAVEEENKHLLDLQARIQVCKEIADSRLPLIRSAVHNAYDDKIEREINMKREKERVINEDADEKIRRINEEREAKLRLCCQFFDNIVMPLKQQKSEILEEITRINGGITKLEMNLEMKRNMVCEKRDNIKELKQDDKYLIRNTRQVLELLGSLHDEQGYQSAGCLLNTLDRLTFIKGHINSSFCGRLHYPSMQWKLIKTIEVQRIENPLNVPKFVGLVGYDSIAVTNHDRNDMGLYVIDLSLGTSTRVVKGTPGTFFVSCSSIDRNRVACGKFCKGCTGDVLDNCVTIHDDKWNQIRTIPIPRKVECDYAYVDVGSDGKILAALYGQSNIHVINPADGEIEDTITFTGKEVRGRIHALSSGSIIARSGDCEVSVIARNGETNSYIYDEGDFSLFRSETLTDTIFVTNWCKKRGRCTVGQMSSSEGIIKAKEVVGYDDRSTSFYRSACLVTPSGKLVLCDEKRIFVYRKECVL